MSVFHLAENYWARINGDNTCWVYIHLPKTAGSSVSFVLRQRFGGESIGGFYGFEVLRRDEAFNVPLRRRFRAIGGHVGRNDIEQLEAHWPNVRFRYFTFLREPITRLMSAYRHAIRDSLDPPKLETVTLSSGPRILSGSYNTQARQLAYGYEISETPSEASDEQIFSRAMETLERCEFVGFYEHLDRDLPRLYELLGIHHSTTLPTFNATRHIDYQFDERDLDNARALTQLDLRVYQAALAKAQR